MQHGKPAWSGCWGPGHTGQHSQSAWGGWWGPARAYEGDEERCVVVGLLPPLHHLLRLGQVQGHGRLRVRVRRRQLLRQLLRVRLVLQLLGRLQVPLRLLQLRRLLVLVRLLRHRARQWMAPGTAGRPGR